MNLQRFLALGSALLLPLVLGACGGGRGDQPADVFPSAPPPAPTVVAGPDSFLLFPNPQRQDDGSFQTNTTAYALAYYAAIDPFGSKKNFEAWKAANHFDEPGVAQVTAVFGDFRDLGYGRRMTARQNTDGTIAFFVENYLVDIGGGGYGSSLNLDAAVVQDQRWKANINAIEFSPGPGGTVKFAKFYSFDAVTHERRLEQDIDGRGLKALPGVCITCHGGRGDPLTPPDPITGLPLFPRLVNSEYGDTRARLHAFEVDALTFSATPGFTRADQEAALKAMNKIVLCSYPLVGAALGAEDLCRRSVPANSHDWEGTAAGLIKSGYGGDGLLQPRYAEAFLPSDWNTAARLSLYQNVVVPACRSCHIVRGISDQSEIDLTTFKNFDSYADRIKVHVFDRGNMPLAKIVFDKFWSTNMAGQLAAYLDAKGPAFAPARDTNGRLLQPGRPIADPGPDRALRPGDVTTLSASASLFANSYRWRIASGPGGTLANPTSATTTFTATAAGNYLIELVASNGSVASAPASLKLVVDAMNPNPAVKFTDVVTELNVRGCVGCHTKGGTPPGTPPGAPPTAFDTTPTALLYTRVRGLVNFTDIVASPLLRKPSGNHHNPGVQPGFDLSALNTKPGDLNRAGYDLLVNWIVNGAPAN